MEILPLSISMTHKTRTHDAGLQSDQLRMVALPPLDAGWTRPMSKHVDIAGYQYVVKADHRDRSPAKSQWTIAISQEYSTFEAAVINSWLKGDRGWGLHIVQGAVHKLGESARAYGDAHELFVGFFEISHVCHGYPSDPVRSSREIPPEEVRNDWLQRDLLRPAAIRKIGRGLRCKP